MIYTPFTLTNHPNSLISQNRLYFFYPSAGISFSYSQSSFLVSTGNCWLAMGTYMDCMEY